jgi:lysophospholipase L1-like esterase
VVLTDSISLNAQLLDGVIEFSDGSNVSINGPLPNDGTPHEVVFTPRLTEWVRVRMTAANTSYQLAEIAAYSSLDPGQIRLAEDLFNDGDAVGWDDSNADCQTGGQSWDPNPVPLHAGAGNQYLQEGDCRGYSSDGAGVELGSYSLKSLDLPDGMDLRLSLRSDYRNADWLMGPMGVLFGYQDNNNYYRLDLSQVEGHRKLYKKEAGVYTELNTSPQSYVPEQWTNLRVVHKNGAILAYVNGSKVLAAEDSTFAGGKIALFCARNESCRFDNVVLLSAPSAPIVGVNITDGPAHASSEYFVGDTNSLEVAATVTESAGFGWVEFVIDEGTGNESSQEALALPYSATFSQLNQGDHTVRAYLLDDNGQRLSDSEAAMELPQVATEGVQLIGMGNSIAGGLKDNDPNDDTSDDLRNTSGGFQSVLNDRLSVRSTMPISILSEGNAGENSAEGLARIQTVLQNNPAAQGYLLLYGANDARSSKILPSGLGMNSAQPGYNDTFKGHMDQIFSAILAAGKQIFPGKALPKFENGSPNGPNVAPLNAALQEFNQVIDELLLEKGLSGSYTAPDFYSYFIAHPAEMDADGIHPNGNGYKSLARGWCESLDGQLGLRCNDRL